MKARYVSNEVMLQCKHLPTDVARERLDVTDAVNATQVSLETASIGQHFTADLTLVRSAGSR